MKTKYYIKFFLLSFLLGCQVADSDEIISNVPPETNLFLFTNEEISKQPSKIKVSWWGDDPDGLVIGYYFTWTDEEWSFTSSNDSIFALKIGAADTAYTFKVAAVDNSGNKVYDNEVIYNGINLGPEPYIDENENGLYDNGEYFFDIGMIDKTPAQREFKIKNSSPSIEWNESTILPEKSFPVITIRWEADDIDGEETISAIRIALNDTSNYIELNGSVRIVTIRTDDFSNPEPLMDIYISSLPDNVNPEKLPGIKLDDFNRIYVQAVDISGAVSDFISLPDTSVTWFVQKPKSNFLLIDDYRETLNDNPNTYYSAVFDEIKSENYDILDLRNANLPFEATTFLETIKLFSGLFWYSNSPNLDLASVTIPSYISQGGKVFFSILLPDVLDIQLLQDYLPVDSVFYYGSVGREVELVSDNSDFPLLKTSRGMNNVRTFYINSSSATSLYKIADEELTETDIIGFKTNDNRIYYFGLALHRCDFIDGTVKKLISDVILQEFGL